MDFVADTRNASGFRQRCAVRSVLHPKSGVTLQKSTSKAPPAKCGHG
jgi:hypothetical protein